MGKGRLLWSERAWLCILRRACRSAPNAEHFKLAGRANEAAIFIVGNGRAPLCGGWLFQGRAQSAETERIARRTVDDYLRRRESEPTTAAARQRHDSRCVIQHSSLRRSEAERRGRDAGDRRDFAK